MSCAPSTGGSFNQVKEQKMESLRNRASKNFEQYLQNLLKNQACFGLPVDRLSESEWQLLSQDLSGIGIKMLKGKSSKNNAWYYFFVKNDLQKRASKSFEKYLRNFIDNGVVVGLPADRLSESEWKLLNLELMSMGVKMVKYQSSKDNKWYYKFNVRQKVDSYNRGREDVVNMLFDAIKKKYPNISNVAILEMINSKGVDVGLIYNKLRFKQDGHYADVSETEYRNACQYALEHCNDIDELRGIPGVHNWNPKEWHIKAKAQPQNWMTLGRHIRMSGKQGWTWFRRCSGNTVPSIDGDRKNVGFHMSLNVSVYDKTLRALDDILIQDGGRYIDSYKFPKSDYYYSDVLTRHDPVTIYMYARNPDLEQKIVRAMQPFVRSNEGLIDEIVGPGCCVSVETSKTQKRSVGQQIANDLADMISKYKDRL